MSTENKAVVRHYIEQVVNKGNLDVVDEIYASDYVNHTTTTGGDVRGREGVKQVVTMFRTAFPDLHVIIDDLIEAEDKVANRITVRGTHKGEWMGIAPTGRQINIRIISIFRISNGKIVERWENTDTLGLMQQLGAVPLLGQVRG